MNNNEKVLIALKIVHYEYVVPLCNVQNGRSYAEIIQFTLIFHSPEYYTIL